MRNNVIATIAQFAQKDSSVFVVCGDAGFGVLDDFKKKHPKRFLNMGVAEQNMISFSAGLALSGFKVFVYNIVPFVLYRCYEQVRNDICYQELPVTLIGIGSGVTYAPQGMTHYSVEDIALARTLPNLTVFSPSDPVEARACAAYACKSRKPVYIRLAKSGEPFIHPRAASLDVTRPITVRKGKKVAVLYHGSVGAEVMEAVKGLKASPLVLSLPRVQPIDFSFLSKSLAGVHTIVTVEEHFVDGGLGTSVADWLALGRRPQRLIKLGIAPEFIHGIKNSAGMRRHYGLGSSQIRTVLKRAFENAS